MVHRNFILVSIVSNMHLLKITKKNYAVLHRSCFISLYQVAQMYPSVSGNDTFLCKKTPFYFSVTQFKTMNMLLPVW